jgi:excinuclease ABC subunit B
MHSDIDTIERIEIIRDLRLGVFDVLVGINLLREGLDIPECAFVGILDADKEGFLRSETSLVQTIGRAARNSEARVVLYADRITGSMERAMEETRRRREKQSAYNLEHGITPTTIIREVSDILGELGDKPSASRARRARERGVAEPKILPLAGESGHNLKAVIASVEKQMREAAANLEFEDAARLRDELKRLREQDLGI